MKKLGIAVLVVLVLVGGAVFWLHSGLDGLVRDAIAKYGSEMTQAKVTVGQVKISALNGEGTIANLVIGNPKGFKSAHAFSVGEFTLIVEPKSITGDVVTVKKIAIIAPDVMYEKGDAMTNFDAIQKNIAAYLGPSDGKSAKGGKKLIVAELTIRGAKAHGSAALLPGRSIDVPLPDLTLRNLGKAKGGVTPGELSLEIVGALEKQLINAISLDKLGNMAKGAEGLAEGAAGKTLEKAGKFFK
jgi:hypothetical protein